MIATLILERERERGRERECEREVGNILGCDLGSLFMENPLHFQRFCLTMKKRSQKTFSRTVCTFKLSFQKLSYSKCFPKNVLLETNEHKSLYFGFVIFWNKSPLKSLLGNPLVSNSFQSYDPIFTLLKSVSGVNQGPIRS